MDELLDVLIESGGKMTLPLSIRTLHSCTHSRTQPLMTKVRDTLSKVHQVICW